MVFTLPEWQTNITCSHLLGHTFPPVCVFTQLLPACQEVMAQQQQGVRVEGENT